MRSSGRHVANYFEVGVTGSPRLLEKEHKWTRTIRERAAVCIYVKCILARLAQHVEVGIIGYIQASPTVAFGVSAQPGPEAELDRHHVPLHSAIALIVAVSTVGRRKSRARSTIKQADTKLIAAPNVT